MDEVTEETNEVVAFPVPKDLTKDDWLMMNILEKGSIDAFTQFVELRQKQQDRNAKLEFDKNFAIMQAAYKPVERTKEVWNKAHDKVLYKFCPLEDILKVYAPLISEHGFSYRWSEESLNEGKEKRIYCIVSGYGHEERSYVDIPVMPGNDFTNSVQQRGVSTSYGKRYSFINAFGIIIDDEDDDATSDSLYLMDEDIKKIKGCKTLNELLKVFSDAYEARKTDKVVDEKTRQKQIDLLIAAKDEMKKVLK